MSEFNPEQIMEAVKGVREIAESVQGDLENLKGFDKEKFEKMGAVLDTFETENAKVVESMKSAENREIEMKERLDVMESELARGIKSPTGENYRESDYYKGIEAYMKGGDDGVSEFMESKGLNSQEFKSLMRTDSDTQGGYLVEGEMDNVITKKITEISPMRQFARVRTTSKKSLEMPIRDTLLEAFYEGEGEATDDSSSTYGAETVTAFRLTTNVPITMDLLMDSSFNMESEILQDAAEAFAFKEGNRFILGTGVKQPTGVLGDSRVTDNFLESQNSGVVDADDFILLQGELKTGYNGAFMLNRRTLATLRTQKSTDGQYLWLPGLNGVVANTIAGSPYALANDVPDIAAGAFPVLFGDFFRGYTITDRTGVSVIRDELTQKKRAIIEFCIKRWNTGQVTLPEAITVLKVKA